MRYQQLYNSNSTTICLRKWRQVTHTRAVLTSYELTQLEQEQWKEGEATSSKEDENDQIGQLATFMVASQCAESSSIKTASGGEKSCNKYFSLSSSSSQTVCRSRSQVGRSCGRGGHGCGCGRGRGVGATH